MRDNLKTEITLKQEDSDLKGQCHEMVVEVRPWNGRVGLN
jgi:hypothetical protein